MQAASNTWVTRCPHCQITFRVSLKHLQLADGAVRCGSCLQIFKAPEHLTSSQIPSNILKTLTPTATQSTNSFSQQVHDLPFANTDGWIHHHANNESEREKETGLPKKKRASLAPSISYPAEPSARIRQESDGNLTEKLRSPIELHDDERQPWKSPLLWGIMNVAAIVVLTTQYLFFNLASLAQQDHWRPFFTISCKFLNCTLPSQFDVSQIQTNHLVIRSTSDYENSLSVDAIINNQADVSQPFPLIELTFSNDENSTIANRQFTPKEYLGGELSGTSMIPPKQPIHLSLQIIDPGQEATNYQLSFYPNP